MPVDLTTSEHQPRLLVLTGAGVTVVLAGSLLMWAYYGTAVFFEMVRAGFVACF